MRNQDHLQLDHGEWIPKSSTCIKVSQKNRLSRENLTSFTQYRNVQKKPIKILDLGSMGIHTYGIKKLIKETSLSRLNLDASNFESGIEQMIKKKHLLQD